jgi:stress response protein YsnF
MGFLGTRSTLIPWQLASVDENDRRIDVSVDKDHAKEGPAFDDDEEITPDYEERVYSHYGLQHAGRRARRVRRVLRRRGRRSSGEVGPGMRMGDTESGEFREHSREQEGVNQPGDDLEDEDELRVQRSEEELRAGTREREAGSLNVRKRVRTDREQVRVPVKHEEVNVERVPVNEEASGPRSVRTRCPCR